MSVLLEFSIFPIGQGESLGDHIARSMDVVDRSGVAYRFNAMGTVLEGEWDEVMGVVRQCFDQMTSDCNRVACTIKLDWRRSLNGRITDKVASVERRLGRQLAK